MKIRITFTPAFVSSYKKLEPRLKEEVREKMESFRDDSNHKALKVHKLHGALRDRYSFSVNYKYRIVFRYLDKATVIFFAIGDHNIYD